MKTLDEKIEDGSASDSEVREYLINEGLDPDQIAHEGSVFVRVLTEKIKLENEVKILKRYKSACEKLGITLQDIDEANL